MFNTTINPPQVFSKKDFIGVWDNVILDDFNNLVIKILDESTQIVPRSNTSVKDSQLDIAAFNPMISNHIMNAEPTEGYHDWHSVSNNIACANRTLVWSVYFNDLEGSGETEFLYQKQKINPKAGRVLIFPGSFTHLHRGNPPYKAKYIATGWLASNDQENILL